MAYSLSNNCTKNYRKRITSVKIVVKIVVEGWVV